MRASVRPFTVQTSISAPREEIFDFLADLSGRPAFSDHYMQDYRLARANPVGTGAAARFKLNGPFGEQWGEIALVECDRPRRIDERGRIGRLGRVTTHAIYELVQDPGGVTRVELTVWTEPDKPFDFILERLGARRWVRKQTRMALQRLRRIFEEEREQPLARATIAGYEPLKAARFGA
jgi:hypothetical protein